MMSNEGSTGTHSRTSKRSWNSVPKEALFLLPKAKGVKVRQSMYEDTFGKMGQATRGPSKVE